MATIAEAHERLRETDGFVVESPAGDIGWVEEVWLGEEGSPRALAVRTGDGRHGLLRDEDVVTVDREKRWVVVTEEPTLLELDAPRLSASDGLVASWRATGERLAVTPRPRHLWHVPYRPSEPAPPARAKRVERPLWQGVAVLLVTIALLVALTITLAYVVARLITGTAY
jgi:hypothetical protein